MKSALYDTETENGIVFSMYPPEQFITFLTHKSPNRNEKTHKDIVYTYPNSENTLLSKAESVLKQTNKNNYFPGNEKKIKNVFSQNSNNFVVYYWKNHLSHQFLLSHFAILTYVCVALRNDPFGMVKSMQNSCSILLEITWTRGKRMTLHSVGLASQIRTRRYMHPNRV